MSLLPYMLDDPRLYRSSRLLDQNFGLVLHPDDFLQPLTVPRMLFRCPAGYLRNWKPLASDQDSGSTVTFDKDKFQAHLDVQQFKPEEITVKVTGENTLTIEGKHEEKEDEHGHIYRHFVRKYVLPKNCDMSRVESKISTDGVLMITAPRQDEKEVEHKTVPITQTGGAGKSGEGRGGKEVGTGKK
ncbi:hypothetical protein NQ318_019574 [Aromia moschata]|uniref:SHSP domain-containing protein n=1 Tax=Aromia moschata TaxID=1265417 RepID=A0AAV8Z3W3_9CUCU|nr:hypothetical protein NQ318_019574 [Aromia moschata]